MSQWTIGKKIAAGLLFVLIQALSVGVYALWMTAQSSNKLARVSSEYLPEIDLAAQLERDFLNARIHFIYFVTVQKDGSLQKGWERIRHAQQLLPKLQELIARSAAFGGIQPEADQLRRDFDSYQPTLEQIIDVVQRNQNHGSEFAALLNEWARRGASLVDSAGRLNRRGIQVTDESVKQASSRWATMTLAGACLGGLLIGLALTVFITQDVGRAMRIVVGELDNAAREVAGAAAQIAGSAQSLSQGASEQAASLEETSASSEEINSMASQNAKNAKTAADNMMQVSKRTAEANQVLAHMVGAMNEINASSDKISKIIKVIDEIAFQTNILALNAAVEAARAGEAGLGFAVVAEEVRNLAQRCAQAAKDTAGLIDESIGRSNDGQAKLNQMAVAVRSITDSVGIVETLVDRVKMGSEEQARGIVQVANAIVQMERVTQTTAAHAEESAAAGEELSTQSEALRAIVARLNKMVGGGWKSGNSPAHVPTAPHQISHFARNQLSVSA